MYRAPPELNDTPTTVTLPSIIEMWTGFFEIDNACGDRSMMSESEPRKPFSRNVGHG
jgi:hypothetical protein